MASKKFTYLLDFKGDTTGVKKEVGGLNTMLKGAAMAAGALFAADKVIDAAKAVGEYAKQISAVRTEVGKLTGLQGAALNATTGQVQAIATAYDQDVNEAIKASNQLMRTFGESNKAAFDIMNAGFASTANSNQDFLRQINEYSIHFKEAGVAASEMVAIIAQGNKMGVFDDKAADTIKEGTIRLREMTQGTRDAIDGIGLSSAAIERGIRDGSLSMFQVMQMVSAQLATMPEQSTEVGTAIADIFGGVGEDAIQFIRSLKDVNIELDDVVEASGKSAETQQRWTNALAEFNAIGAQVFGGTNGLITELKATMMEWLNSAIRGSVDLINYFIDLYNESMEFRLGIEYIAFTFKQLWNTVKTVFNMIGSYFRGIGRVWKAIFTGNFDEIGAIVKETFIDVGDDAKIWGQNLAENFNTAVANTLTPKEKIAAISLTVDDASAAGTAAGMAYAQGFGKGAGRSTPLLPGMTAKTSTGGITDTGSGSGIVERNNEVIESNNAMAMSYTELGNAASSAMGVIANAVGGTTGSWLGFAGTLMEQIPQLIASIMSLTGASIAGSTAVVGAKQGEAMASAAAGAAKLPFPASLVAMLGAVASVAAIWSSIPKAEDGGIIPGNSFTGDKMMIRANSGEEVLRRDDPRHALNQSAQRSGGATEVHFMQKGIEIAGDKLRILLERTERMQQLRTVTA